MPLVLNQSSLLQRHFTYIDLNKIFTDVYSMSFLKYLFLVVCTCVGHEHRSSWRPEENVGYLELFDLSSSRRVRRNHYHRAISPAPIFHFYTPLLLAFQSFFLNANNTIVSRSPENPAAPSRIKFLDLYPFNISPVSEL